MKNVIILLFLTCMGCAHRTEYVAIPLETVPGDSSRLSLIDRVPEAVIGPVDEDAKLFSLLKQLEDSGSWADPSVPRELEPLLKESSQTMLAATLPEVFRVGVVTGTPGIITLSCEHLERVTHGTLRRINRLEVFQNACELLDSRPILGSGDVCRESVGGLLEAWSQLKGGNESLARQTAAEAVRRRGDCESAPAIRRAPVSPDGRGFLVVVVLQAVGADPLTWLGGERTYKTAVAINEHFTRNVNQLPH